MFLSRRKNRRSNFKFSFVKTCDVSVGTINPFAMVPVTTGDVVRFQPSTFVQAMAQKAPLVNGFKVCLEYFFAPNRLYHGKLLFDETNTTRTPSSVVFPAVRLPQFESIGPVGPNSPWSYDDKNMYLNLPKNVTEDSSVSNGLDNLASLMVCPGSILDFMGFPVGWIPSAKGEVPSVPDLVSDDDDRFYINVTKAVALLDIILTYYANQEFEYLYTSEYRSKFSFAGTGLSGNSNSQFEQVKVELSSLQEFVNGLKRSTNPSQFIFEYHSSINTSPDAFMTWKWLSSPMSLFQRSLPPYYLEQWLRSSYGSDISDVVKVDVTDNSVVFEDVRTASHFQRYLELAMAGGARYSDYLSAQFDTSRVKNFTSPLYLGSDRFYLGSNIIYQTTGFDSVDSPLGSFAGQMAGGQKYKKRSFRFGEDGVLFVMVTLMPDTIYYRGLDPFVRRLRLDDFYSPALDNVGMEPLTVETLDSLLPLTQVSYTDADYDTLKLTFARDAGEYAHSRVLGFVPAWSSTVQPVSRAHGQMQGNLKYWLLPREYAGSAFDEQTQSLIDQWLEQYAKHVVGEEGFVPQRIEALRIFFDNVRRSADNEYVPYVQNHLYNSVFADTSYSARNFVFTLSIDMTINREKSKSNIANTI